MPILEVKELIRYSLFIFNYDLFNYLCSDLDSKKSAVDINLDVGLGDDDDDEQSDDRMDVDNEHGAGDALPNNLDQLVATYSYTMSARDLKLVAAIHKLDPSLDCLVFRLLESQTTENSSPVNDTLSKQAKITDFISLKLNDNFLAQSVLNFPLGRKLDTIDDEKLGRKVDPTIYDPVYMLPNIYHLLDYGKRILLYIWFVIFFFLFKSLIKLKLMSLTWFNSCTRDFCRICWPHSAPNATNFAL